MLFGVLLSVGIVPISSMAMAMSAVPVAAWVTPAAPGSAEMTPTTWGASGRIGCVRLGGTGIPGSWPEWRCRVIDTGARPMALWMIWIEGLDKVPEGLIVVVCHIEVSKYDVFLR